MTDSNNSGNNSIPVTGTVTATQGQPGQVFVNGTNGGTWITVPSSGNCAAGGYIPGQTYTITIGGGGGGGGGQITFDDIDLAVPVNEKKEKSDGCSCKKCKEYCQYAEPNQDDGTLICYSCRTSW